MSCAQRPPHDELDDRHLLDALVGAGGGLADGVVDDGDCVDPIQRMGYEPVQSGSRISRRSASCRPLVQATLPQRVEGRADCG